MTNALIFLVQNNDRLNPFFHETTRSNVRQKQLTWSGASMRSPWWKDGWMPRRGRKSYTEKHGCPVPVRSTKEAQIHDDYR